MSKHTPGPWELMDSFYPSIKEVAGPSFSVKAVMFATDLTERDYQERLADLRLIAAAPDLIEALNKIKELRPIGREASEYALTIEQIARAAIAKATGKEND